MFITIQGQMINSDHIVRIYKTEDSGKLTVVLSNGSTKITTADFKKLQEILQPVQVSDRTIPLPAAPSV